MPLPEQAAQQYDNLLPAGGAFMMGKHLTVLWHLALREKDKPLLVLLSELPRRRYEAKAPCFLLQALCMQMTVVQPLAECLRLQDPWLWIESDGATEPVGQCFQKA